MHGLSPGASMVTVVIADTLRLVDSQPSKKLKKSGGKGSVALLILNIQIVLRKSLFCGRLESWDHITQSSSRRPRCVTQKFGKERVHRMVHAKSVYLWTKP